MCQATRPNKQECVCKFAEHTFSVLCGQIALHLHTSTSGDTFAVCKWNLFCSSWAWSPVFLVKGRLLLVRAYTQLKHVAQYHIIPTDHHEMSFTLRSYVFLSASLQTELQTGTDCTSWLVCGTQIFHI